MSRYDRGPVRGSHQQDPQRGQQVRGQVPPHRASPRPPSPQQHGRAEAGGPLLLPERALPAPEASGGNARRTVRGGQWPGGTDDWRLAEKYFISNYF